MTTGASSQREQDLAIALELRERLDRATGPEWMAMSSFRTCFGGDRLTRARKTGITEALIAVSIDVYPPLEDLSAHDKVRLEVLRPSDLAP